MYAENNSHPLVSAKGSIMQRTARGAALLALAILFAPSILLPAADSWKAGAAKVNITPETYMWMAGYAARTKPADSRMTDLWAKALVLEDTVGKRAVLIT